MGYKSYPSGGPGSLRRFSSAGNMSELCPEHNETGMEPRINQCAAPAVFGFPSGVTYLQNQENCIPAYSNCSPSFSASHITSSGHREHCTSPIWALRRKNIQMRD